MTKSMLNPFRPARVEFERPGFLWVSPLAKRVLTSGQPVYIGGARGSGKTSILRILSSREQILSPIIRMQLPPEALDYFSILLRVPTHLESISQKVFSGTLTEEDQDNKYREFSLILELHALQVALADLIALQDGGGARVDASSFTRGLKAFVRESGLAEALTSYSETIEGLYSALDDVLVDVQNHVFRRISAIHQKAAGHRPGVAISSFARNILPSINLIEGGKSRVPRQFRVCVDECEFLAGEQQKFLNTVVRASEYPVTWVVAFVPQKFDRSNTIFEGSVLSGSDRQFILLDDVNDAEFASLCQAVASMRLYYALSEDVRARHGLGFTADFFDLQKRLGKFTLADLSMRALGRGLKRERADFIQAARELGRSLSALSAPATTANDFDFDTGEPPLHLAYALQRLGWTLPLGEDRRTLDSFKAALRKKSRAGFLGVCREFRVQKAPLAGYRIVLGLSDKCIRDFLNIMATLFEVHFPMGWEDNDMMSFATASDPMRYIAQRDAIHAASKQKYDDLPQHFRSNIDQGQRLIDALGSLTYELQTRLDDRAAFTLPERGIFRIDLGELDRLASGKPTAQRLQQLLRIGRVEGYLRDVNAEGGYASTEVDAPMRVIWVRLHRLLAPYFGLSYRGALHTVNLPTDLWMRVIESDPFSAENWTRESMRRLSEQDSGDQEELPFV